MSEQNDQPEKPPAQEPPFIPVPWAEADDLQARLKKDGLGSTVHLDPASNKAQLELWSPQKGQEEEQPGSP
jgi:hypothetical protein